MFKNGKFLIMMLAIGFLMSTFSVVQAKGLPPDVEKWLKKNKIGPYTEDKVDYKALYQAAKKEGKVVVYANTSRGPKSLSLGFYDKYPGIKVEWNTLGTQGTVERTIKEHQARIYAADIITCSDFTTQVNVMHPANMIFPWVPPGLKKVIPRKFRDPILCHRMAAQTLFYSLHKWPDKPPVESWWDITKPEWKGRLVMSEPNDASPLQFMTTIVLQAEAMAKEYERVFGKPLKLTTPNAGYEWIKMVFANEPKLVRSSKEGKYIAKPGQAKPSLGICWDSARITDSGNPKYGNIRWTPHVTLKPRIGMLYPAGLNIAYKAAHPNAAKLLIRYLFGDEKGGGGNAPWFTPGGFPTRSDIKRTAAHPFIPELSWAFKDLNFWFVDSVGVWKEQKKVLNFINKQM